MYDPQELASLYDLKVQNTQDLNNLLGKRDQLIFNHNGILLPDKAITFPHSEGELLSLLHEMEIDQAKYCIKYLGSPRSEQILLDAGCGAGGTSIILHRTYGCVIEGVTLSPKQVEVGMQVARFYGYENAVHFFVGDILNLTCDENYYDFVYASENTEHLPDLNEMYKEFRRATKPGGRLVIVTWCATDGILGSSIKSYVDNHYKTHIHTQREYVMSAEANGWLLKHKVDMTHLTAPYWQLRASSEKRTGSEGFMGFGFSSGSLEYFLFAFDLAK